MNTLIFRTAAPIIFAIMLVFSIFILLRGHNEPGGGFIGGLIAASGIAIYALALGVPAARKAMRFDSLAFAGLGVVLAGFSGLLSLPQQLPFLTGLWADLHFGDTHVAISTPMIFDIGVYLVVLGSVSTAILGLQDEGKVE